MSMTVDQQLAPDAARPVQLLPEAAVPAGAGPLARSAVHPGTTVPLTETDHARTRWKPTMTTPITRSRAILAGPEPPSSPPVAIRPGPVRRILNVFLPVPEESSAALFREAERGRFQHHISLR